jgi:hypothetical protein
VINKGEIALVIVFIVFFSVTVSFKLILILNTLGSYNILQYTQAQPSDNQTSNNNPEAKSQSIETEQGKSVKIQLKGSDEDGDTPLTFFIESYPSHGTLSGISEDEDIPKVIDSDQTYIPDIGFTGDDEFEFFVDDTQEMRSDNAIVTITVVSPTTVDNASTAEDQIEQSFREKIWQLFRELPTLEKIIVTSLGLILSVLLVYGIYKIIKRIMKPVITVVTKGGIIE